MSRIVKTIAVVLSASLLGASAFGQAPPAKPTAAPAAPSAAPAPSATPAASAKPSASASAQSAPSGSASALPPGHPPTGDLPPGHPPTGDMPPGHPPTGDVPPGHPPTGAQPGENPHGGQASPHGPGGGRRDLFDAPPDTATDDPSLPVGTIALTLKDENEQPLAGTAVSLGILHNTVATGESRERKSATTDSEGIVRWEGMAHGSATSYRVSVTKGSATFGAEPFALSDRAGKRVLLHVYPTTSDVEEALVGTQGLVYLALREDSIVLEHLYGIFNLGAIAWVPEDVTLELPAGYKAFNRPDSMDGVGVDEVNGKGRLRGTIGPGRHDIQFRYQVPLDEEERQTIRIELPPHVAQMRVMVEASKSMGVTVPGFDPARKTKNRDGKRVLVTEKRVTRDSGGLRTLEITLTGLPEPGPGRWLALALAVCAVGAGFLYAQQRSSQKGPDEELRRDLVDAREALLRDIVELEKQHRAGAIGPKTYERLRGALLDALDRLVVRIQSASPPPKQEKKGAYRKAGAKANASRVADADEE